MLYKFPQIDSKLHINQKEAHSVIMLLYNLRKNLTGKNIISYVDNTLLFDAMCKRWSSASNMMKFIYEISLLKIEYAIELWLEWMPSKTNV